MTHFFVTESAKGDLTDLWLYITEQSYATYADKLLDRLYLQFELLAQNPGMGTARDEIGEGVRLFPVERVNIIYRIEGGVLHIVRVHHSALDSNKLEL